MSDKETIVALKSDEQASLSPGAYEVLTGAVQRADPGLLVEVGWRYVPSEVWGDQVLTQDPKTAQLAREYGRDVQPLYALTPEDVEAVNAARKEAAWKASRRLGLCRCDHIEYCQHCFPVAFRPGGVWGGPNAELTGRTRSG